MPELPELEVFSANLHRRLSGKTVTRAEYHKAKRLNVTPEVLKERLEGKKLTRVYREGKGTVLLFGEDSPLGIHLMLKGEFHISRDPENVKYRVLSVLFDDGEALVAADPMALMTVTLDPEHDPTLDALAVTLADLQRLALRQPGQPLKVLLLDQNKITGIGNAYADEICYRAGIAPQSLAGRIPEAALTTLAEAIRSVLENGIAEIRKSHPEALGGEYRHFMAVHNPERTHCPAGNPILTTDLNKRKTYYTEAQTVY